MPLWLDAEFSGKPVTILPVFTHLSHLHEVTVRVPWAHDAPLLVLRPEAALVWLAPTERLVLNPWPACAYVP